VRRLWPFLVALVLFVILLGWAGWQSYGDRLPGATRMCAEGVGVGPGTSCQLAVATRDAVRSSGRGSAATFTVTAYDPQPGAEIELTCDVAEVIRCLGGQGREVVLDPTGV